jgi:hypothetical protein
MLGALRYMWVVSKGYRLRPWQSPYLRWRLETYFGPQVADLKGAAFFRLLWRERARLCHFLAWVEERQREQRKRPS